MADQTARVASRRREQTQLRLLDAAHEVFGEVGMDAASVEMICERAGFTRGAFYSNFESKEDLFLALMTHLAEAKLEEVAERVRDLDPASLLDPAGLVHHVVGVSVGGQMEPHLIAEIRTQALRDPRMAAAYLSWQDGLRTRVEAIIRDIVGTHGVRLRLPIDQVARLLLEISDDTCLRAAIEGVDAEEMSALLNSRLEQLVSVLVDLS